MNFDTTHIDNRKIEQLIKAKKFVELKEMNVETDKFYEGLYRVRLYIDKDYQGQFISNFYSLSLGRLVTDRWFDEYTGFGRYHTDFIELIIYGDVRNECNLIDLRGNLLLKKWVMDIYPLRGYDDCFIIYNNSHYNFFDVNRGILSDLWYTNLDYDLNGLVVVEYENYKNNVFNLETGSLLFKDFYRHIKIYENAIEICKESNRTYNLADLDGNILYKQWFDHMELKNSRSQITWLMVILKEKINYVNPKGQFLLKKWADGGSCMGLDNFVKVEYDDKTYFVRSDGVFFNENQKRTELVTESINSNAEIRQKVAEQLNIPVENINAIDNGHTIFNSIYHIVEFLDPETEEYVYNVINNRGDIMFKQTNFINIFVWWRNYFLVVFPDETENLIDENCKFVFPFKSAKIERDYYGEAYEHDEREKNSLLLVSSLDNKYAYFDWNGKQISEWFNDLIMFADKFVSAVERKDKWNFIRPDGTYVLPKWVDKIRYGVNCTHSDSFTIHYKDKSNIANKKGKLVSKIWFDKIGDFYRDDIIEVKLQNRANLLKIDFNAGESKLLSEKWFYDISPTNLPDNNGYAMAFVVFTDHQPNTNLIDKNGNILSDVYFSEVGQFDYRGKTCWVRSDRKANYIDPYGKLIFDKWATTESEENAMREKARSISFGLNPISENKKNIVKESREDILKNASKALGIKVSFVPKLPAYGGSFVVRNQAGSSLASTTYYVVDSSGKPRTRELSEIRKFKDKFLLIKRYGLWNMINSNGDFMFPDWVDSIITTKDEDTFIVELDNKQNIVKDKKLLSDIWFDAIYRANQRKDCIPVVANGVENLLNLKTGKLVLKKWVERIVPLFNDNNYNTYQIKYRDKYNFCDTEGNIYSKTWFSGLKEVYDGDFIRVTLDNNSNFGKIDENEKSFKLISDKWFSGTIELFYKNPNTDFLAKVRTEDGKINILKTNGEMALKNNADDIVNFATEPEYYPVVALLYNGRIMVIDGHCKPLSNWVSPGEYQFLGLGLKIDEYKKSGQWPVQESTEFNKPVLKESREDILKNAEKAFGTKLKFTETRFFNNGFLLENEVGDYYIVDNNGKPIIKQRIRGATFIGDGEILRLECYELERNNMQSYYNLIDKDFNFLLPLWVDNIGARRDENGKVICWLIEVDKKFNIVKDKTILSDMWFDHIFNIDRLNNIVVKNGDKVNLFNIDTRKLILSKWVFCTMRCTGGYMVTSYPDKKLAIVSPDGKLLSQWFDKIEHFKRNTYWGLYLVSLKGLYNILDVDKDGKSAKLLMDKFQTRVLELFADYHETSLLATVEVETNQYNILKTDGSMVFSESVGNIIDLSGGGTHPVALVFSKSGIMPNEDFKYTLIDADGNQIIEWRDKETFDQTLSGPIDKYRDTGVWPKEDTDEQLLNESIILNEDIGKYEESVSQHLKDFAKRKFGCTIDAISLNYGNFINGRRNINAGACGDKKIVEAYFHTSEYGWQEFFNIINLKGVLSLNDWAATLKVIPSIGMVLIRSEEKYSDMNLYNTETDTLFFKDPIDHIDYLTDDYFFLRVGDKCNIINSKKELSLDTWFDTLNFCGDLSYAIAELNNKNNLLTIKNNFKPVFDKWYDDICFFDESTSQEDAIVRVKRQGKYNLATEDGKILSKIWFDDISFFTHEFKKIDGKPYFLVMIDGLTNYLGADGKLLFKKFYGTIEIINDGKFLARVKNDEGNFNLIDMEGNELLSNWLQYIYYAPGEKKNNKCIMVSDLINKNELPYFNLMDYNGNLLCNWVSPYDTEALKMFNDVLEGRCELPVKKSN